MSSRELEACIRRARAEAECLAAVERGEWLDRGHSPDRKYVFYEGGAPKYLLRVSPAAMAARRRREFALVARHRRHGVRCPQALYWGAAGAFCYGVFSYVRGEAADGVLPTLTAARQFALGRECGRQLQRMHQVAPPGGADLWPQRRLEKFHRKTAELAGRGFFHGQERVEAYIAAHLHLLHSAPVRFQHDDFHPANIIIRAGELAGIIDFNRCDWGDPIEDFFKVPKYTCPVSIAFACGQIAGYRAAGAPGDFWPRYNLYVALNQHASALMGYADPPGGAAAWRQRMRAIVDAHDWDGGGPPQWYREDWT